MPTYFCTTLEGRLTAEQKRKIAGEVTRVHCEFTGAPGFFAQVIFQEVRPGDYFIGGRHLSTTSSSSTAISEADAPPWTSRE
jgi:phenylpyruvate tautomerase PptA (4-oxalocrotonate tautomerase family)